MLGNYSKLIGGIVGSIGGFLISILVTKGLAVCTVATVGVAASCSVFGIPEATIEGAITTAITAAVVHYFPANKPA